MCVGPTTEESRYFISAKLKALFQDRREPLLARTAHSQLVNSFNYHLYVRDWCSSEASARIRLAGGQPRVFETGHRTGSCDVRRGSCA